MKNRIFTLELKIDDEQSTSLPEAFDDAFRIQRELGLQAVAFKWGDVRYTCCADGRVIQQVWSYTDTVYPHRDPNLHARKKS